MTQVYFYTELEYNINKLKFTLDFKNRKDDSYEFGKNLSKWSDYCADWNSSATWFEIWWQDSVFPKKERRNRNKQRLVTGNRKAQAAFTGAAEAMGIYSENDIQELVNEVRYGKEK